MTSEQKEFIEKILEERSDFFQQVIQCSYELTLHRKIEYHVRNVVDGSQEFDLIFIDQVLAALDSMRG